MLSSLPTRRSASYRRNPESPKKAHSGRHGIISAFSYICFLRKVSTSCQYFPTPKNIMWPSELYGGYSIKRTFRSAALRALERRRLPTSVFWPRVRLEPVSFLATISRTGTLIFSNLPMTLSICPRPPIAGAMTTRALRSSRIVAAMSVSKPPRENPIRATRRRST